MSFSKKESIFSQMKEKRTYSVFEDIECFSKTYGKDSLLVNKVFSILYVAMIAEETKNGGKLPLKKRVKRLGVHQVLIDGFSAERAARFSYGFNNDKYKNWKRLN